MEYPNFCCSSAAHEKNKTKQNKHLCSLTTPYCREGELAVIHRWAKTFSKPPPGHISFCCRLELILIFQFNNVKHRDVLLPYLSPEFLERLAEVHLHRLEHHHHVLLVFQAAQQTVFVAFVVAQLRASDRFNRSIDPSMMSRRQQRGEWGMT